MKITAGDLVKWGFCFGVGLMLSQALVGVITSILAALVLALSSVIA